MLTNEGSYDSYPYVAVVMLSDTTHMIGGETYIKKGDGSAAKVCLEIYRSKFYLDLLANNLIYIYRLRGPP
jgi:hypothetical protein